MICRCATDAVEDDASHAFNCSMLDAHAKLCYSINAHVMLFTQPLKLLLAMLNTDVWHSHFTLSTHSSKHISLKRLVRRKRAIRQQMKHLIMIIFNLIFEAYEAIGGGEIYPQFIWWKYIYKENRLAFLRAAADNGMHWWPQPFH